MDPRRLRIGEWLLAAGGLLLLAATFLDWYGADGVPGSGESAWEVFSVLDVFLAVVAVWALGVVVMTSLHNTPAVSLAMASMLTLVASVALIVLVVRAIAPPELSGITVVQGDADPTGETSRLAGLWLGLAACALTAVGALASIRDERFPRAARIEVPVETIPPPEGGNA